MERLYDVLSAAMVRARYVEELRISWNYFLFSSAHGSIRFVQGDAYSVASRQMVANKKPINDIALAPSVSKALVLAGKLHPPYTYIYVSW